jgi:hypothetical protein
MYGHRGAFDNPPIERSARNGRPVNDPPIQPRCATPPFNLTAFGPVPSSRPSRRERPLRWLLKA